MIPACSCWWNNLIPPTVGKKNAIVKKNAMIAHIFHSSESGNNQSTQHFAPQPNNGFNEAKGKAISDNWMFLYSCYCCLEVCQDLLSRCFVFFVVVIFMDCNHNKHEATENLWCNLNSWKLLSRVWREMN